LAKRSPKVIYATDLSIDNLQDLANEVAARFNVKVIARAVDAASEVQVQEVVNDALENYGRLDVFYANAGMASPTLLKDQNADSFMKMMRVNALR
jgi:NADP-dependent 3-hydroxy acid dehydrogenase YdfG